MACDTWHETCQDKPQRPKSVQIIFWNILVILRNPRFFLKYEGKFLETLPSFLDTLPSFLDTLPFFLETQDFPLRFSYKICKYPIRFSLAHLTFLRNS